MAISKSRLGRGLGNLIAGGISSNIQPPKPAAKPVAKPAPKPAPKPAAKPVSKPAAKPTAKKAAQAPKTKPQSAKPVAKPAAKSSAAKPVAKPAVKPSASKPAPTATAKPVAKPAPLAKTPPAAAAKPAPISKPAPAAQPQQPKAPAKPATTPVLTSINTPAGPATTPAGSATAPAASAAATGSATASSATATAHSANHAAAPRPANTTAASSIPAAQHSPAATTAQSSPPLTPSQGGSTVAAAQSGSTATVPQGGASAATTQAPATGGNSGPYREILVNAVVPNPYQPRREIDPEHIAELANSIASEGLLQPIVVRPLDGGKGYELIAGERRWRAHQKLGLKVIAARIMTASDASSAVISLIENIQRQALNPIEEALGFASLMRDFDLTQEAVSERIGRARASIANSLRLLALDREIQGYVAKGILSVGHAKILLGLDEPAQRLLIARRIIETGLSVRDTETLVRRIKNEKHSRPVSSGNTVSEADRTAIADLEKQLSSKLNTKVFLKHAPKKGRIVIEYYGNEDLQRILERTGLQF